MPEPRNHHLAQINIARFRVPMADPANTDFIAALDRVNAVAESTPGFVWRLVGEGGDATDIRAFDDPDIIVNMSTWTDVEALAGFTYRDPAHLEIMRRRREWFERMEFFMALWWVPAGHRPTPAEGKARLELLRRQGAGEQAFTFAQPFGPPGTGQAAPLLDRCA